MIANENIVGIFCFIAYPFAVSWILFYFSNKGEEARENIERDRANLMERKLQDCEEKLSAIDGLIVRRIKHHQEMKDGVKSGMARKRENYKLHVLSETLGEIRKLNRKEERNNG